MGEALHLKAPRLPKLSAEKPENLIGNSTEASIRSGIYNGYVAMVEGLITRMRTESGIVRAVGTGGNAERLSAEFAGMMTVDPDLILNGLMILARR
jgi:type III pantothenate kinase